MFGTGFPWKDGRTGVLRELCLFKLPLPSFLLLSLSYCTNGDVLEPAWNRPGPWVVTLLTAMSHLSFLQVRWGSWTAARKTLSTRRVCRERRAASRTQRIRRKGTHPAVLRPRRCTKVRGEAKSRSYPPLEGAGGPCDPHARPGGVFMKMSQAPA